MAVIVQLLQDGSPVVEWTLQTPSAGKEDHAWKPEGVEVELGSGAGFARRYTHRGFRRTLALEWEVGTTSTRREYSGGSWSTPVSLLTATAVTEITYHGAQGTVRVLANAAGLPEFDARSFGPEIALSDIKGIAHGGLSLALEAISLVSGIVISGSDGWGNVLWGNAPWGD